MSENRDAPTPSASDNAGRTPSDATSLVDVSLVEAWAGEIGMDAGQIHVLKAWLTDARYESQRPALVDLVERGRGGDADARAELVDAFSQTLPIGTGGRRGHCGAGPNRVNDVLVRETVEGVVRAVTDESLPRKVAVVYDTRRDSRAFAYVVSAQLRAHDFEVVLVDRPRPTPQLSFLARRWGCGAGIVISASHNPPGDNGIKIYGPDGAQVIGARDRALMTAIESAADAPLPRIPQDAAQVLADGVERIDPDEQPDLADAPYHAWVSSQGVFPGAADAGLRVVFTPLHGVGHTSVVPVLRTRGIDVQTVAAQVDPDGGNFSTVESANPESPASMDMAVAQAKETGADLVLATDPDADRIGAVARGADGTFAPIDGNRLGALMLDHVLRHGGRPERGWVITTTVTTPLVRALADEAGVDCIDDLLVGFKHHAAMVAEAPDRPLVFACEESHGYVRGVDVRDKDGAVGALLLAECAADCKREGKTLFDRLEEIWRRHGYHRELTTSLYAHGAAGRAAIAALMAAWRSTPPTSLGGLAVQSFSDRAQPRDTGSTTRDLPGNVLSFELAGSTLASRVVLRPSGTEPKAKLYVLARGHGGLPSGAALAEQRAEVDALVEKIASDARQLAESIMAPHLSAGGGATS